MRAYAVRFAFGAGTSVVAAVVTLVDGATAGGVFLAFPAILAATLTLLETEKGPVAAVSDARGAIAGALGLVVFAAVAVTLHDRGVHPAAGLAAAMAAWVVAALGLYVAGEWVSRLLRLERYPPAIPCSFAQPLVSALRERGETLVVVDAGAGGALAAVLAEVTGADGVVVGSVVAPDAQRACRMLDLRSDAHPAQMAATARTRWQVPVAVALVGAEGGRISLHETFHAAVATPRGIVSRTFETDRGGEDNWGQGVLAVLRLAAETVAQRDSTSSRMPVRSSPSIEMSMNDGTQTRSMPPGAT